jgi:hypothetical protein
MGFNSAFKELMGGQVPCVFMSVCGGHKNFVNGLHEVPKLVLGLP